MPPRHLFEGATQQHHDVRGGDACFGSERELKLAGPEFDFERLQRQPKRDDVLA